MNAAAPLWTGPSAGRLTHIPLDTLTAVFDHGSGQTHVLAEPLPQILTALDDGPADTAQVIARLHAIYDLDADSDAMIARVDDCLRQLATLGLVGAR